MQNDVYIVCILLYKDITNNATLETLLWRMWIIKNSKMKEKNVIDYKFLQKYSDLHRRRNRTRSEATIWHAPMRRTAVKRRSVSNTTEARPKKVKAVDPGKFHLQN